VMVIINIWAMTRNEAIYPEPDRFNPDRFFTAEGELNDDETILTFGFGRRICPGRHTADASVWCTIVSVLATFDIGKRRMQMEMRSTSTLFTRMGSSVIPSRSCALSLLDLTKQEI